MLFMNMDRICKAFGNQDRLKLLVCLSTPQSVTDLLDKCTLSQSALSQHLKILRDAKVVKANKIGKFVLYEASNKKVTNIAKLLLNYK